MDRVNIDECESTGILEMSLAELPFNFDTEPIERFLNKSGLVIQDLQELTIADLASLRLSNQTFGLLVSLSELGLFSFKEPINKAILSIDKIEKILGANCQDHYMHEFLMRTYLYTRNKEKIYQVINSIVFNNISYKKGYYFNPEMPIADSFIYPTLANKLINQGLLYLKDLECFKIEITEIERIELDNLCRVLGLSLNESKPRVPAISEKNHGRWGIIPNLIKNDRLLGEIVLKFPNKNQFIKFILSSSTLEIRAVFPEYSIDTIEELKSIGSRFIEP